MWLPGGAGTRSDGVQRDVGVHRAQRVAEDHQRLVAERPAGEQAADQRALGRPGLAGLRRDLARQIADDVGPVHAEQRPATASAPASERARRPHAR